MAMLNRGKGCLILFLLICLFCCTDKKVKVDEKYNKSVGIIGKESYMRIYHSACDSISIWRLNESDSYTSRYKQQYKLDSLLWFNKEMNRFIRAL